VSAVSSGTSAAWATSVQPSSAHSTSGDGAVLIADVPFTFITDSGTMNNLISTAQATKLFPYVTVRPLPKPLTIATASSDSVAASPHLSCSCMETDVTLSFPTGETRTVNDVQLYSFDNFGNDIFLRHPLLHQMNINVIESLKAACQHAHIIKSNYIDAKANEERQTDAFDTAAATSPVYLEVVRVQDVNEGKTDTDAPIGPVNPAEVWYAVDNLITNAQKEGLSDAGAAKLRAVILEEPSLNAFRTQLGPDPPIDTEPVRVTVDPAISQSVKQASHLCSPLKSAFMLAHVLLFISSSYSMDYVPAGQLVCHGTAYVL
jgi:hypothetical protein